MSIEQKMAAIEVINLRLFQDKTHTRSPSSINVAPQKINRIKDHMKKFDLSSPLAKEGLQDFTADFMLILKNPPGLLLEYFLHNKTKKMNEKLFSATQEDILLIGLKGVIERIPTDKKEDETLSIQRANYLTKKFFQYQSWKYVVNADDQKLLESLKIPSELLEKIMLDGLVSHDQELITHLKTNNMIDNYERFRKIYRPAAFALSFYLYYDQFHALAREKHKPSIEREKIIFTLEFKNLANTLI